METMNKTRPFLKTGDCARCRHPHTPHTVAAGPAKRVPWWSGGWLAVLLWVAPSPASAQFGPVTPQPLNSTAASDTGADYSPKVVTDGQGTFVAVWAARPVNDSDILFSRSVDGGRTWTAAQLLDRQGNTDAGDDFAPQIATDRQGRWMVIWHSNENLGGTNGTDGDLLFSVSTNQAVDWSPPRALSTTAGTDSRADAFASLAVDGRGHWLAAWHALGEGSLGTDQEIWYCRSGDGGDTWSAPVPLNSNAATDAGNDFSVTLGTDRRGTWIAVWCSTDDLAAPADSDSDLVFARSFDNGATWSPPEFVSPNAGSDDGEDFNPQIACDRQGRWVVVWESGATLGGTIGTDQDILVTRSTDNGTTWSSPAALNSSAFVDSELDSFPSLATDAAGAWVCVWHSQFSLNRATGNDQDILAAWSIDQGLTWSAPAPLAANATTDAGADSEPAIATDEQGLWLVAWTTTDSLGGTLGSEGDILYARVSEPLFWTARQALNTNADTDLGNDFAPRLATDGVGNWVAVWFSDENLNGTAGTDNDIFSCRSADNGVTWSAPALLNSNGNSDVGGDRDPSIATDGKGHWVTVWASAENLNGQLGTDGDILFSVSTNAGALWSPPQFLNRNATNDAVADFNPSIATDRRGNWVAAWGASGAYGNDFDLLAAYSTNQASSWSSVSPLNSNALNDDGDDFEPQVASDGQGRWIAVWQSNSKLTGLGYDLGDDDDLLIAYSADNGATWSSPRPLNSNAATDGPDDDDFSPRLATDGAGTWIVVCSSEGTLGGLLATNFNVLYTRSTNNGATWSALAPLNSSASLDDGDDRDPWLAVDGLGRWLAVWTSRARNVGGQPRGAANADIAVSVSTDLGASWSPPAALNTDAFISPNENLAPSIAVGGGSSWLAAWSLGSNLLGADSDLNFARVLSASLIPPPIPPVVVTRPQAGGAGGSFSFSWTGGLAPFQIQMRTNLATGAWINTGGLICTSSSTFPISSSQAYFRVLGLGQNTQAPLSWIGQPQYFQGAVNAVASTLFVDGFGINDSVDLLISGAVPLTVQRTLLNQSRFPVAAGYTVQATLQAWNFLAVGGSAGYVPGELPGQQVFDCQTMATPALLPGQSATISFILGGPGCPPATPIGALSCGLYQESMTVLAPTVLSGLCTNTLDVTANNFLFVSEPNQIRIAAAYNPNGDPNTAVAPVNDVWVFAALPGPVTTHTLNITTTSPTFSYFVRCKSPIIGPQAPTIGALVPAIPQSPAPPALFTGNAAFNYTVTVNPAYNGLPACNVIGLLPHYEEKVNTKLTAISTNGCAIAQETILATGLYECQF